MKKIFQTREFLKLSLLAVLVGIVGSFATLFFRYTLNFFSNLILLNKIDFNFIAPATHEYGVWIILFPTMGIVISAILVWKFADESMGHAVGVAEVIEAVQAHKGVLKFKMVCVNLLATVITICSGASVGKTGPAVQFASFFGALIGKWFKLHSRHRKIFVGCAAASAISALFNAPIAAVIFAMELIVLSFRPKTFILLAISSVSATLLYRLHLGFEMAFFVPQYKLVNSNEWALYFGLGIFSALGGVMVIKSIYGFEDFFTMIPTNFITKAIFGGLIVGSILYIYPELIGVGYEVVDLALQQKLTFETIIVLVFLKALVLGIAYGAGGCGGVVAPSLYVGAMLGASYGMLINKFFPGIAVDYPSYALLGMAGVFAATNRASFTAIILIFEVTLDRTIVLPVMLVCVVAHQVAAWLSKNKSIYSIKLERRGVKLIDDFTVDLQEIKKVKDVMETKVEVLNGEDTLYDARQLVERTDYILYPVINSKGIFIGIVQGKEILFGFNDRPETSKVKDLIVGTPFAVYPNDTVYDAVMEFHANKDPRIMVVDPQTKKFLGMITPDNLVPWAEKE